MNLYSHACRVARQIALAAGSRLPVTREDDCHLLAIHVLAFYRHNKQLLLMSRLA